MTGEHVGELLESMAGSSQAFTNKKSKNEFFRRVLALSTGLQSLGMECGDRVVIAALNSDCYLEWMLAVPCGGGILAPLNHRWSVEEAIAAVELVQPVILVLDEHCSLWSDGGNVPRGCESQKSFLAESVISSFSGVASLQLRHAPEGVALICFTSGTTGTPKGVSLTHKALMFQSLTKLRVVGYSSSDVYLHTAPLCHIGGISSALATLMAGSQHVFLPKFEARAAFEAFCDYKVSAMIVVPTMLKDLLQLRNTSGFPVASMITILNGGGHLSPVLLQPVRELFPNARLYSAYGMTEASSSITFLHVNTSYPRAQDSHSQGVCVGKPCSQVEIRIGESNKDEGNVFTRGPHVMYGYWRQTEETYKVLSSDGWLDTGDIGRIDNVGNLWLLGRAKDMIKTGGQNVYASEVEAIIAQHPSVAAVAVFGIPDSRLTEVIAAAVVLKKGWTWEDDGDNTCQNQRVSSSQLRSHCFSLGLSRFKVPKIVVHRQALPITSTGKIVKHLLSSKFSRL